MRKKFTLAAAASALLLATFAQAQQPWVQGQTVSQLVVDDGDVAILLRYQGALAAATYEVDASGDILLKHGATEPGSADTTVGCPSLNGQIDVSNALCDTVGEAVDAINASANWVAVPLDSLRSDTIGTAIVLLDEGPLNAQDFDGVKIRWDTSLKFDISAAVTDRRSMRYFASADGVLFSRPFIDFRAIVHKINEISTYGTGSSTIRVYSVNIRDNLEVVTEVWSEAGGATATAKILSETPYGFIGRLGEKVIVRIDNTTAMSAAQLKVYAMEWQYR